MRITVAILLIGASAVADAQITVQTDKPVNGARIEMADLTPEGAFCRAPLGPDTYFKLDNAHHLFVVQPKLRRAAELNGSGIAAYRLARSTALKRLDANNKTLTAAIQADPQFKAGLASHGSAPNPHIAGTLLKGQSIPTTSAKSQPRFIALEHALAGARQQIAQAQLSETLLGMATTCVLDVSRLPITATQTSNGETRTLYQRPSDVSQMQATESYTMVSLYELMENFGKPQPTEHSK